MKRKEKEEIEKARRRVDGGEAKFEIKRRRYTYNSTRKQRCIGSRLKVAEERCSREKF